VLGLVVGYSGEASSDVYRVADLVATRLASKHLEYIKTPASIAKAMQTQRICCAWGHFFAHLFARVNLDRVRDSLDPLPGSGEAPLDVYRVADLSATRLASKHLEYIRTPV
jgi:hypothetical protein